MSKGVKIMMGKPTETADLTYWDLIDTGLTDRKSAKDQMRPSENG